jgi:hypothetical protein
VALNLAIAYCRDLWRSTRDGWNDFWFTPADPATLGAIRVLGGLMLLYTHLVWSLELVAFFGPHAWLSPAAVETFYGSGSYAWSYLWWLQSPAALWTAHIVALIVFALLTLGLWTRIVSVLAFLITVAYANRVPGALFGLDDINVLLAMYLMVGKSGGAYSMDRWLATRRAGGTLPAVKPSISANVAIRLIQLHMCVVYLFAGLGKLQGETWWTGSALMLAFSNLEYQTLDMTWLADWPLVVNFMTHLTVFWELSFTALVWPRRTRPLVLLMALPPHLGIGLCLGMMTFGLVMLIGCLSFVPPALVRAAIERLAYAFGRRTSPGPADPGSRKGRPASSAKHAAA